MTANENRPENPDAELARTRQHIEEAKEAAEKANLVDPDEGGEDASHQEDSP